MEQPSDVVQLHAESLNVSTRAVDTGRVRVRTVVEERTEYARADLLREAVEIERVAIGREVDRLPDIREEGDTIIVPVVQEVLVVEKRLVLVEEVHLKRARSTESIERPVTLRSMTAVVERDQHPNESVTAEEPRS